MTERIEEQIISRVLNKTHMFHSLRHTVSVKESVHERFSVCVLFAA